MMLRGITLVLCLVLISSSSALYCYECVSEESFEQCDVNRKKELCGEDEAEKCGSITVSCGQYKVYERGCASDKAAEEAQKDCKEQGCKCQIDLCEEDFCSGKPVSGGNGNFRNAGGADFLNTKRNLKDILHI